MAHAVELCAVRFRDGLSFRGASYVLYDHNRVRVTHGRRLFTMYSSAILVSPESYTCEIYGLFLLWMMVL